jgi:PAS domain S-box-containing protein
MILEPRISNFQFLARRHYTGTNTMLAGVVALRDEETREREQMNLTDQPLPDSPAPAPEPRDDAFQLALLAAIVESSDDAIVSKTLEGRILSWNRGATRIFGYEAAEAIGKPITIIIPPELYWEEEQILARLRRGERIDHFDTTRVTKDGRRIPISLAVSPIRDPSGVIVGASKVARDISERKRTEEALREANRRKDEFLALLAHELRNPLAPIRYALAASKRAGTLALQKRTEEIIERQVTHMTRLLDDLMDTARITRGALEVKKTPTDLTYIIGTAIETTRPILNARRHNLSLDLPKQSVRLEADPVRLAQVLSNLLINAAKYTNPGGQIALRAVTDVNGLMVAVRDNGIGISPELMPRLFDPYARGDAFGGDEGGLGIGLSLVRALVTLHGGTVEARSDGPGTGSEFIIRLPLGLAVAKAPAVNFKERTSSKTGLNVLVVDDNRDAAEMCAILLEVSGHHVRRAYTGAEALELAHALRPHVLLADIGLPDIDGLELAQKIRTSPWGSDIVLIAVTGWGNEDDRQKAFASGFDYHLTKPASAESIESILRSVTPLSRATKRDHPDEAQQRPS